MRLSVRHACISLVPALAVAAVGLVAPPASANPGGTGLVISEVYGGGGNSGGVFRSDFVELANPTSQAVALDGLSLQYRSAGGSASSVGPVALHGSVPAGGHYLVKAADGSDTGQPDLPTPDATTTLALSATGGQVLLVDGTSAYSGSGDVAGDKALVDAVGWGSATTYEGAAAPATTNATSVARNAAGADTDSNKADFTTGAPTPQSTATSDPGGGDPGGPAGTIAIADLQGTETDSSPYSGQTVTTEGVVTAAYPTGGFNGFTIQTAGTGGATDATPGASDAVFVYGSASAAKVKVGDSVQVTGRVQEFAGETELSSPTVTQVTPALAPVTPEKLAWSDIDTDAEREAHESELIAPQGDYTVTDNYDLNYYGTIVLAADSAKPLSAPTDVARPGSDDAKQQAAYNASHAITLDDGSSWNYSTNANSDQPLPWLTADHSVTIGARARFGSGGVVLDYRNSTWNLQPTHQVTDTGTDTATFTDLRHTANAAPRDVGGEVRLATFNMENFFVETGQQFVADGHGTCSYYDDRQGNPLTDKSCTFTDGSAGPRGAATTESYQRQLAKEVWGINHLDASIVSLEEVENSAKYAEDRDHALSVLVDALNADAGAGTWAYVPTKDLQQPPVDTQDVIRSAFIYKPATVSPVGAAHILSDQSGDGQPFSIAREPLAQEFKAAGRPDREGFLVVSNHFKSKGADANGLFDDCPGGDTENSDPASDQGGFNCTRVHEANAMSSWAEGLAADAGVEPIFMVGDFNAYTQEDPMEALYAKGYTDVQTSANGPDAKATYSYGGQEGSLDHVLANGPALAMVTGADVWQIDGQEPVAYAYSRYNYNVTQLFSADDAFGTSDHDPEVVGLRTSPVRGTTPAHVKGAVSRMTYGDAGSVRVRVTAHGAAPTGTVTLVDGSKALGGATLGRDGTATIEIPARALAVRGAPYRLTLEYSGDQHVAAATGRALVKVVAPGPGDGQGHGRGQGRPSAH